MLITFVFSVYLTDSVGKTIDSRFTPTTWLAIAIGIGGIFIALLAPVIGQRSDARGTRRRSVRVWTLVTMPDPPGAAWLRPTGPPGASNTHSAPFVAPDGYRAATIAGQFAGPPGRPGIDL